MFPDLKVKSSLIYVKSQRRECKNKKSMYLQESPQTGHKQSPSPGVSPHYITPSGFLCATSDHFREMSPFKEDFTDRKPDGRIRR